MDKKSKKKIAVLLIIFALIIGMMPTVQSDTFGEKPPPDYGVYEAMEEVQDEKNSHINSKEILNETKDRFDEIKVISDDKIDITSKRTVVTPDIPKPEMLDIFNALEEWNQKLNNDILDWILPIWGNGGPLNYYIFSRYNTNTSSIPRWTNASLRRTIIYPEPNLSKWWGVDVDDDTVDDIEVYFNPTFYGITVGELIDRLLPPQDPVEVGVRVHYNIHKLNDAPFNIPEFVNLEVYIAKSMSYNDMNFLLFIGLNLTNVVGNLNCSVSVEKVRIGDVNFTIIPGLPPSVEIDTADILQLSGPYSIQWDSNDEPLSSIGLDVATARIEFTDVEEYEYEYINRSWVDVDFERKSESSRVPNSARLYVEADDDLSSFDKIEWDAFDPVICNSDVRFFDSQENVTYAEIEIQDLPVDIDITMEVVEENGENITIIEYDAESTVTQMTVHHYEFFDTSYENITPMRIANGDVEYIHLFLNIERIPKYLYLKGVFYLEEVDDTPSMDPGFDLVGQLLDSIVHRVISRFTRIAKTLESIPYRLLTIAEEGGIAVVDTKDEISIGKIEFIFTSGDYVTISDPNENYFAFYNITRPSQYPIAQISLSGRISEIDYINASFEDNAFAEVRMMNDKQFRGIYADDINNLNAEITISNVPGSIFIYKTPTLINYVGSQSVDELRFLSEYQNTYMDISLSDTANFISVEYTENRTNISTGMGEDKIGEIEFVVTTGPVLRMNGNHLLLRHETDYSLISGRIKDVSSLDYIPGEDGKLDIDFAQENVLNISLFDNRSEKINADLIIDPIPKFISVNFSGLFSSAGSNFQLPHLKSGGVLGIVGIIFGVAGLGNEILTVIDDTTQNAMNNIGSIIENLSFSYKTISSTTLIGKILRGNEFTLDDVDWMHGISAIQQKNSNETSMAAKLYLSGLPSAGSLAAKVKGEDIFLDFHLKDYNPKHDWLCIDVRGIQNKDVMLYLNDIESGMDLDLMVNLKSSLNTIPQTAIGTIQMNSNKKIGSLLGRMRQTESEISVSEIFLSSIPKSLYTTFNLSGNIGILYMADSGIEHMYVKTSRTRNGEFHDIYAILHELPEQVLIGVIPVLDYDMDGSLLQSLPTIEITSSQETLDTYIFADGKGIGQIGLFEVQVVNMATYLSGSYSKEKYHVDSMGVEYLWVHVMELPVMEGHKTRSIEVVGKDIKSFDIKVDMLFGNYPIITIEDTNGGEIQLVLDHEMNDSRVGIAMFDLKIKNGFPSSPSILINGGSLDLDKDTTHVLIPAPMLTLMLSVFS